MRDWRKLRGEGLRYFCTLPTVFRVNKSRNMRESKINFNSKISRKRTTWKTEGPADPVWGIEGK